MCFLFCIKFTHPIGYGLWNSQNIDCIEWWALHILLTKYGANMLNIGFLHRFLWNMGTRYICDEIQDYLIIQVNIMSNVY